MASASGWWKAGNSTRSGTGHERGHDRSDRPVPGEARRSAAIAGIVFALLLMASMIMMRLALSEDSLAVNGS
jgi:hypothetical protein